MTIPTARSVLRPEAPRSREAQLALEQRFFKSLRLPNGTYKTTAAHRMPDVDALVVQLTSHLSDIDVLDVGISSGITTLELLEALEAAGHTVRLTGCDLSVDGMLRHALGADLLLDRSGRVLQLATPFLVKGRPHDPEGSLRRRLLQGVLEWYEHRLAASPPGQRVGDEPVQLLSLLLAGRRNAHVVGHDLTVDQPTWRAGFDVVRAANVLNRSYFDDPTLIRMLEFLRSYLRPGGLLVLNRTLEEDGVNHGSVLVREADGRLSVRARLGRGSEVEGLAVALGAAPAGEHPG